MSQTSSRFGTARSIGTLLLSAGAVGYVVWMALANLGDVTSMLNEMDVRLAVLSVGVLMVAMCPLALAVIVNLRMLGEPVSAVDASYAYFLSQLGKYVPGKVWIFLIRARVYSRCGIANSTVAFSLAIEVLLSAAGAMLAVVLMMPGLTRSEMTVNPIWIFSGAAGLLLVCSPPVLNRLVVWLYPGRRREKIHFRHVGVVLGCYIAAWLGIGFAFLLLARACAQLPMTFYPHATAAFALGLVAGYMIFLAPAGIGIRELVLTTALSPYVGSGRAAALALLGRVWWTIAELGCIAIAAALYHWRARVDVIHDSVGVEPDA